MSSELFTVKVERHGVDYYLVIENNAGRRWLYGEGHTYPDNLGEQSIELAYYLNEGGKVEPDHCVELPMQSAI